MFWKFPELFVIICVMNLCMSICLFFQLNIIAKVRFLNAAIWCENVQNFIKFCDLFFLTFMFKYIKFDEQFYVYVYKSNLWKYYWGFSLILNVHETFRKKTFYHFFFMLTKAFLHSLCFSKLNFKRINN